MRKFLHNLLSSDFCNVNSFAQYFRPIANESVELLTQLHDAIYDWRD